MRHGGMGRRWSTWTAAGLTAAVVLTGCSSDSGDKNDKGGQDKKAGGTGAPTGGAAPAGKGDRDPKSVWAALLAATTTQQVVEYRGVRTATGDTGKEQTVREDLWSWYDAAGKTAFTDRAYQVAANAPIKRSSCEAGKEWSYNNALKQWTDTKRPCVVDMAREGKYVGDGILPTGLTAEQAKTFAAQLEATPGWLTPSAVEPAQQKGKSYLRLTVDLKPQPSGAGSSVNTDLLLKAFRATIPDFTKGPYQIENFGQQSGSPVRAVFWIDPATHLPAYSEVSTTVVDKGAATGAFRQLRTEYVFGGPAPKPDHGTLVPAPAPTWPEQGTKPPQV
ncbi:hypothetical protein [Embleya sp. NPDC020886]|uniref:hypothetical protein n=1 Tax=Embleya sp. NPDC020886 TaxID=3363980 RepID=UPI0037B6CA2D